MIAWLVVERMHGAGTPPHSAPRRARWPAWSRSLRAPASSGAWRRSRSAAIAGAVCCFAISLKFRYGFDDALDVVAVHLVGGIIGSMLLGLFAETSVNPAGADGLFFGGGWGLFGEQVLAVAVVFAFSFVVSGLIGLGLRRGAAREGYVSTEDDEQLGLDLTQHSETGYAFERI